MFKKQLTVTVISIKLIDTSQFRIFQHNLNNKISKKKQQHLQNKKKKNNSCLKCSE